MRSDARDGENRSIGAATPVRAIFCALLRTKNGYFRSPAGERLIDQSSSTACYHCVLTQRPYGPDGMPVNAVECGAGRGCFISER
jgi:hypothetical protein